MKLSNKITLLEDLNYKFFGIQSPTYTTNTSIIAIRVSIKTDAHLLNMCKESGIYFKKYIKVSMLNVPSISRNRCRKHTRVVQENTLRSVNLVFLLK